MKTYRISPSLLNSFQDWLNSDELYEKFWANSEAPAMTQDEFRAKQLAELLAYINREPQQPNEAADRGTALNELIDVLNGSRESRLITYSEDETLNAYAVHITKFCFLFDKALVCSLCDLFKTAFCQFHAEYEFAIGNDRVVLHGYPDYIFPDAIWDLKTTGKYDCEKYRYNWQRHAYPLAMLEGGKMQTCDTFTFYALECHRDRKTGVITAKPFAESYNVNVEESKALVKDFIVERVIPQLLEWQKMNVIPNQNLIQWTS